MKKLKNFINVILIWIFALLIAKGVKASPKNSISARVNCVRESIVSKTQSADISKTTVHFTSDVFAQWNNWGDWGNWNNWANWDNWANWNNWGNWGNWYNY